MTEVMTPPVQFFSKSRSLLARARASVPGCSQTFSKGPGMFARDFTPNFIARAKGAYCWDVDGNRYIDYISGLGPIILGHGDPDVTDAVKAQLDDGVIFSLPHPLEVEVAELLKQVIPCAERVRFGKNGSDATAGAVRLARAYTGRDKVLCGGYHGWQDWFIGITSRGRGVPQAVKDLTFAFPYNNLPEVEKLFADHPQQIACVILEPVTFQLPAPNYLAKLKSLCHANGALLIFDEIVTGFRLAIGGAQAMFGVTPDLACFGKAMANGFPLSAIVGRADIMKLFEEVFFSFTFGGDAISLAACKATIQKILEKDVITHLTKIGTYLQSETNRLISAAGLSERISCIGYPQWSGLAFRDENGKPCNIMRSLFQQEAIRRNILTHGNHMLNLAHDKSVVNQTLAAYAEVFGLLADAARVGDTAARLVSGPITPVFRQV
jgi:glutamate-1-semialdehyde-2,1-aminomutase